MDLDAPIPVVCDRCIRASYQTMKLRASLAEILIFIVTMAGRSKGFLWCQDLYQTDFEAIWERFDLAWTRSCTPDMLITKIEFTIFVFSQAMVFQKG